jgi:hypothetical protein
MSIDNLPYDIRLWLLAADQDTGILERDLPLPVAHDAFKRGLVREEIGGWVLTDQGRTTLSQMLNG